MTDQHQRFFCLKTIFARSPFITRLPTITQVPLVNSLSSKGCRLDIDVEEGVALQLHQLANQGARLDRVELKDVRDKVSQTLKRDVRRRWTQWCWDRCDDYAS